MTIPAALLSPAIADFQKRFRCSPTLAAWAPGRVNLMGDHTDYSGGLAMPCAIDLYTVAVAAPSPVAGGVSRMVSTHSDGPAVEFPAQADTVPRGDWADYLRGVRAGYDARGVEMPALDVLITGDLPLGSGLSSSASLELCFASLLEAATHTRLPAAERALLCQTAEHDFAGVPCGILDQFAIAHGQTGHAMILDCADQSVAHSPLPRDFEVVVIDSGVRHDLSDGSYAARRQSVMEAAEVLGKPLRETDLKDVSILEDPVLQRRATHVVTENRRVPEFAAALAAGDWDEAGRLMIDSHRSLAEDFAVSCKEVDWLVAAVTAAGAYGARMTGGGFGGSIVCLAPRDRLDAIERLLNYEYTSAMHQTGTLRRLHAVDAAGAEALSG